MARRNGNEIQDRLLGQMERLNRHNQTDNSMKSLADQLSELNLSPQEKQKRKSPDIWHRDLMDVIYQDKYIKKKMVQWVLFKFKKDIEDLRLSGASYKEVISFIRSKEDEYREI